MPDTHFEGRPGGMTPERLQSHVSEMLAAHKTRREIVDELTQLGLDPETASQMVTGALDAQWNYEGGSGPVLWRVGPRHMIAGLLVMALGGAATAASVYAAFEFDARVYYVFYGAVFAGAMEFVYGLIRYMEG